MVVIELYLYEVMVQMFCFVYLSYCFDEMNLLEKK